MDLYINLFHLTVLKVSLLDFVGNNLVSPGTKPSWADASRRTNLLRRFALLLAITNLLALRRSRHPGIKTPPSDEIPSIGGHYYYYILTCWSVGLIMASVHQQTVTKQIKMVASVLYFFQRHQSCHWHPSSSGGRSSNNRTLYLHIQQRHRWARHSNSPSCRPETSSIIIHCSSQP